MKRVLFLHRESPGQLLWGEKHLLYMKLLQAGELREFLAAAAETAQRSTGRQCISGRNVQACARVGKCLQRNSLVRP
jgi:hypothetical protein